MGERSSPAGEAVRRVHAAGQWRAAQGHARTAARGKTALLKALAWAAAITAAEAVARRTLGGRSLGWLAAYPVLAAAGALAGRPARRPRPVRGALWLGIPLALAGYPLGCRLLGHRPSLPPPDLVDLELAALAVTVAPAEELVWGRQVEPRIGVAPTALLFAAKHVALDGRWRRGLGLALFWTGLGLVRSRSPRLAAAIHVATNAGGVLLGHSTGRDQF